MLRRGGCTEIYCVVTLALYLKLNTVRIWIIWIRARALSARQQRAKPDTVRAEAQPVFGYMTTRYARLSLSICSGTQQIPRHLLMGNRPIISALRGM